MKKLLLIIIAALSLQIVLAQQDTTSQAFKFYDRFGEEQSIESLQISSTAPSCTAGYFELHFVDPSGSGFNDAILGLDRQAVACQVFKDLSTLITPANDPYSGASNSNTPLVHIKVSGSISDPNAANFALGMASSNYLFLNAINFPVQGEKYGEVWKTINGGIASDENNLIYSNLYQGEIEINFLSSTPAFNWHTNITGANSTTINNYYDLYSVILHEAMHALGIGSFIDEFGQSKVSGTNCFSHFDTFLKTTAGTPLIDNTSCYAHSFESGTLPNLIIPCNNGVEFAGTNTLPIFTLDPLSPNPNLHSFSNGSSLSHFYDNCSSTNFVMNPSNGTGSSNMKRKPTHDEVQVLCDLGYKTTTTYGEISTNTHSYDNTYTACGSRIAGVDDYYIYNTSGIITPYQYTTSLTPITISDVLENDEYNGIIPDEISCLQMINGISTATGTVTQLSASSFTYQPTSPGLVVLKYRPKYINTNEIGNVTYIFITVATAQNNNSCCPNITNEGFEITVPPYPNTLSQIQLAAPWSAQINGVSGMGGTSDLFNVNSSLNMGVPTNNVGYEPAHSGNGYAGIISFAQQNSIYREYLVQELPTILIPGGSYEVSMWVSRAEESEYYSSLGMYLADISNSNNWSTMGFSGALLHNTTVITPNVDNVIYNNNNSYIPLDNDSGWTEIKGTYNVPLTSTNINGIIVGNFDIIPVGISDPLVSNPSQGAYYYIDDVCITPSKANFDISQLPPFCLGDLGLILDNYINPGLIGSITYTEPNGTVSNGVFNPTTAGTYTITATYIYNCTTEVETQTIEVITCCDVPNYDIYLPNGGTEADLINQNVNAPGSNVFTGLTIWMESTTTISSNITFNNCDIYLGPYAEIKVDNNAETFLTLDSNTHVQACSSVMWQGIYVNEGMIKVLNNTIIEDGIEAIVINKLGLGGSYQVRNSTLKNNWKSLINYSSSGSFYGNTVTNDAPLLAPHLGDGSFTGILLHNSNVTIGSANYAQNTFSSLKFGIVGLEGDLGLYNNRFVNIDETMSSGTMPPYSNLIPSACVYVKSTNTAYKALTVGGTVLNQSNTFEFFRNGIYAEYMNNTIIGNSFYEGTKNGIRTQFTENTTIQNNDLFNVRIGVRAHESRGSYLIENNSIEKLNGSIQPWQGVAASNTSNSLVNTFKVENNCVNRYQYGINVPSMYRPRVHRNHVNKSSQAAVRMVNTNAGNISNNSLTGYHPSYSLAGISITNSDFVRISSNRLSNFGDAAYFSGAALHHHLDHNEFRYSNFGVVIDHKGAIGPQGSNGYPRDNKWVGFTSIAEPHLQTRNGSDGNLSPFFNRSIPLYLPTFSTHDNSNGVFAMPVAITSSSFPPFPGPNTPYQCNFLQSIVTYPQDTISVDLQMMQMIADGDTLAVVPADVYNNQELLYKNIKDSTDLLNNDPILSNFVDNKECEDMGLICRVEEKMLAGDYTGAVTTKDSIIGAYVYEQNAKDLYSELLAPYIRGEGIMDLTTAELDNIKDIAYLCPFTDGLSIYTARAVCRLYDEDWIEYSNPCEAATNPSSARIAAPSNEIPTISLYPNPARTVVYVQIDLEDSNYGYLELINTLGQSVGNYLIQNNEELAIDISELPKGMYICKLIDANGVAISNEKLTIE